MQKEYSATQTNAKSCYKNVNNYNINNNGDGKIYPPTPVTIQPLMFAEMRPHNIPINNKSNDKSNNYNCSGYYTLNQSNCETTKFTAGFNDITRWN